jgi:chromosome segregation ATPase
MVFILAFLTLAAARLSVAGDHPAVKIIALIQKLQQQVKEEGAEDTHLYGKFTYWCDETTKLKKKAIGEFEEIIDVSKSTIEALEADIETLNMEIAQLAKEIEEMEEARTNATKIREAEHAVYMKSKTDLEETIQSIKDCITAMKEGMEGSFLQAKTLIDAWGSKPQLQSRSMAQFL